MAIRRTNPPPYVVMRKRAGEPSPSPSPGDPEPPLEPPPPSPADEGSGGSSWWERASHPVVLRVPRGMAVIAVALMAGVIALAYWVGRTRGYEAADAAWERRIAPSGVAREGGRGDLPAPGGRGDAGLPSAGDPAAESPPPEPVDGKEPREEGKNYFMLAYCPEQEAAPLLQFLWGRDVDAAAVRDKDRDRFQVFALRPFAAEELSSEARRAYQEHLRRLGRTWKSRHRGATDLAGLYPAKYKGTTGAPVVIMRETP